MISNPLGGHEVPNLKHVIEIVRSDAVNLFENGKILNFAM